MRAALLMLCLSIYAQTSPIDIDRLCLDCHRAEGIPSRTITKRYFMNYSSLRTVTAKMKSYLKNPDRKESILPRQFKPNGKDKQPTTLSNTELDRAISRYIERHDMRRDLVLEK